MLTFGTRLETVEGKVMAIDSSIWIYQFQATMRDKEGRGLVNAHVLGFLRRIAKLLFYGIKPVFVFDGGAPTLKRATLNERRRKKSGAAVSHIKLAEKLLAAQMRREALNHAKGKGKASADVPPEEMVYLEDLEPGAPRTPPRPKPVSTPSSSTKKKSRFHDHDPYKLPEVDLEAVVHKLTQTSAPDPRLATEEELRTFIEEMRPEDFDLNSPAFRELPTEIQYEIVGDLRLKSRQTSFARLQKMLSASRTPLDFSKQQIENLRQRNALTQQLLITTDSIGSAHISIPVRIASERNKEYVLIKNDDGSGGWILGVRDPTGNSRDKPIEIDQDEVKEEESGDDDMEEVEIPSIPTVDPDLREWQRENTLDALSKRRTDKGLEPLRTTKPATIRKPKVNSTPLFEMHESDFSDGELPQALVQEGDEEDLVAFAIQESFDNAKNNSNRPATPSQPIASSSSVKLDSCPHSSSNPKTPSRSASRQDQSRQDDDEYFATASRLQTALRFAHSHSATSPSLFGRQGLLSEKRSPSKLIVRVESESDDDDMEPVPIPSGEEVVEPSAAKSTTLAAIEGEDVAASGSVLHRHEIPGPKVAPDRRPRPSIPPSEKGPSMFRPTGLLQAEQFVQRNTSPSPSSSVPVLPAQSIVLDDSDEEMEEVITLEKLASPSEGQQVSFSDNSFTHDNLSAPTTKDPSPQPLFVPSTRSPSPSRPVSPQPYPMVVTNEEDHDDHPPEDEHPPEHEQEFDAADLHAEEGEFAKFVSQVKGRDLDSVRREIDEEIATLNQQKRNAMRDAEDVNQQMISQIMTMLRLFGIPYITAPMEAEAQCAELTSLGLVDGVITDDSDVFLFGASRVFKNMFNQSKTVECFLLSDLERELGLDRDTLIQLAYLLGSDYTEGLAGVGPVVAMELVREFPGKDGLWKFKEWWTKVQTGKDGDESNTKFRKMFKKRFKDLYIAQDWPNTAVRDAYYHPTVDSSDEPFKWGLPDLDGLRAFFNSELGWPQSKVDELLLPIIQKMNKRSQTNALNKQGNLTDFFGVGGGSGTIAPRQRQAYASKRLQQVVSEFRKKRGLQREKSRGVSVGMDSGAEEGEGESEGSGPSKPVRKRKRTTTPGNSAAGSKKRKQASKAPKGPRGTKGKGKGKATAVATSDEEEGGSETGASEDAFEEPNVNIEVPLKVELRARPKPRPRARRPPETDEPEASMDV
ncbi:flap structure-specific endonuclease [Coprinopsis cinerea okayama7|uniref:Flap structure-specific endonuclease n=1 Tax=Coprinopsis cinerea (strain Okayama-7 / 130 / ATCC MYA-4618 / FGSC 9003) TaxID=240176 RepID=A8NTE4_COPC7|nr:flap structure-specific endonuclease [Coprinopsis cinerea okayama7\|eukprot:XP_001836208.2 flap structure-specific endonuclease [Coprinopsis cinerea okayama7\